MAGAISIQSLLFEMMRYISLEKGRFLSSIFFKVETMKQFLVLKIRLYIVLVEVLFQENVLFIFSVHAWCYKLMMILKALVIILHIIILF